MAAKIKEKHTLIFWLIFIGLITFRLWLIAGIPKMYIDGLQDDLYYAKAAHYILHGQWMGPYNQLTLIKMPFYAFFLILSFFTGLPLFLNETIFYVIACVIIYVATSPLIKNRWCRLVLFTVLLFCPASLATDWTLRVYREFVYVSLTLFVVAFSIGLFLRLGGNIYTLLMWGFGLGISMGAFMIAREEGIWIYPTLLFVFAISILIIWKNKFEKKWIRTIIVLLPIILWYIPTLLISQLNYSYYGFWGTTEQLDPDFTRVLNTLDRIETDDRTWYPTVQIPQEARMDAYEASPILNTMKDDIESAVIGWNYSDDLAMALKPEWFLRQYGNGGGEIGSHFLWLFRDVAYTKGYYSDGKTSKEFYRDLADQLEAACSNGKLECSNPQVIPFIGAIDRRHFPIIRRMFYENLFRALQQDNTSLAPLDVKSWPALPENNDDYRYFEEFSYNSINYLDIQKDSNESYLVNGKIDIRLRILPVKKVMMEKIATIYKGLTLPAFTAGFIAWISLSVLIVLRKQKEGEIPMLILSLFMMGLLITRLLTLTIVDATTTAAGIRYGASINLFVYLFSYVPLLFVFERLNGRYLNDIRILFKPKIEVET